MPDEKKTKTKPQRKNAVRLLKWLLIIIVVLIVLAFLLTPAFVSSEKGRKIILVKVNKSINGRADFTDLSMGWSKGVRITDLSFNDSAGWAQVQVAQIATKPHYASILMGNLSFGETTIDQPKVNLNLKNRPTAETEHLGKPQPALAKAAPIGLVIDVVVNDGSLKVTDSKDRTVEVSQINSTMSLRPPGQQTSFKADMAVGDKGSTISAAGQVTPGKKTGWTFKGTSGRLTVEVNDLDLGSLGPVFALAGVDLEAKGRISTKIESEIKKGKLESASGIVKGSNVNIVGGLLKGDQPSTSSLDVTIQMQSNENLINVNKLEVKTDWLKAQVKGAVPKTMKSLADLAKTDSEYSLQGSFDCNLAAIMAQFPHSIGVKEAAIVTSGRLSGAVGTKVEAGQKKVFAQLGLEGLRGTIEDKAISLSQPIKAEAEVTTRNEKVVLDKMDVTASFAKLDCSGSLESLQYNADVDLSGLQAEIGQFVDMAGYKLAGKIFKKGTVSIKGDKITAGGLATIKDMSITSKDGVTVSEPQAQMNFAVGFDRKEHVAAIDSLRTTASFGRVDVTDAVVPVGAEAKRGMELTLSAAVDLEKLRPLLVIFASLPKETLMAGIAESKFKVSSAGDLYTFRTDSTTIRKFELVTPGQKPFSSEQAKLNFDGDYDFVEKDWAIRKFELLDPNTRIIFEGSKNVKGDKTQFRGRAQLEYDWSVLSSFASQFLPKGMAIEGRRKDTIEFTSEYPTGQTDKLLANLNSKAKLGFDKAQYLGLNFGPTEADIQIRDGLLEIAPFATSVNNGQFKFAAQADFKQKPAILKTPGPIEVAKDIQINKETTEKLLMYVNPIFANAVNVSGVANFNCERLAIPLASEAKNDIEVIGTIAVSKLRLQASDLLGQILTVAGANVRGQVITIHPTKFFLQKGFLRYDDMQVDVGDNPVNFKGVIGLDKSLDMMVTLPYTISGRTARLGREIEGERITLPLKGTIEKPELDMGKLLQEQLKQQLEEQLRKALEGILR